MSWAICSIALEEPEKENDRPIDSSLEQDLLDHGTCVKPAQKPRRIRQQHRLTHNQRRRGCDHEAPKASTIVSENEVGGQNEQIEADREEHQRRQDFPELFDYECKKTRHEEKPIPRQSRQDGAGATPSPGEGN